MTYKTIALEFDAQDRLVKAAEAYERAILEQEADLEVFANLAVLYLTCLDPGHTIYTKAQQEFLDTAWSRAMRVPGEGLTKLGNHPELLFWYHYVPSTLLAEELDVELISSLAREDPGLTPYFYLFSLPEGDRYLAEAKKLYTTVQDGRTAKERYIRSILKPRLTRKRV